MNNSTVRKPWLAATIVAGLFLLAAMPFVLANYNSGQVYFDNQNLFHLKVVKVFSEQIPRPDLSDYASATTPLYHLVLAVIDRYVSDDVRVLRTVNVLMAAGLLATLAWAIGRENCVRTAIALCLPLVTSWYIFGPAVWLDPGNAGLWGVTALLIIAMRPIGDIGDLIVSGIVLLMLVMTRQSHLWIACVLWLAAWLGGSADALPDRIRSTGWMILVTIPAFLAVGYFFWLWRGSVPPSFQEAHTGGNPAIPAMILAIFGICGMFFLPLILPMLREQSRGSVVIIIAGGVIGWIIGIVPHTSFSREHGRLSGLWNIISHFPVIADRSPIMILMATVGGILAAAWFVCLPRRERWIYLAVLAAFTLASTPNFYAYHRYYEPFALIMLGLTTSRILSTSAQTPPRRALWGPVALAVMLSAATIQNMR
jgi:hypothetical protein